MQITTILSLLLTASISFAAPAPAVEKRAACTLVGIPAADANRVKASFTASGVVRIPMVKRAVKSLQCTSGYHMGSR